MDLGYPGESKSFLAGSGCLLDEAYIGYGSITVDRQLTVPGKWLLERQVFCRVLDRDGKFPGWDQFSPLPVHDWIALVNSFPTPCVSIIILFPLCSIYMSALHYRFYGAGTVL